MLKILVVDDEKQARDNMIHCINVATNGFEIIGAAADGSEALEMIRQTQPDIVLIDIQMPGISGLDVIAEARKEDLPVTFIIISSYSEFSFAQEAIRLGVFEYLLKPFMPADVCAAVYKAAKRIVPPAILPFCANEDDGTSAMSHLHVGKIRHSRKELVYPFESERAIIDAVQSGTAPAQSVLSAFYSAVVRNNATQSSQINCLIILYVELHHLAIKCGIAFASLSSGSVTADTYSVQGFYEILLDLCTEIQSRLTRQSPGSASVVRAMDFIQEHFTEELSLEYVSSQAYISPAYLSGLFKQVAGVSFADYIHILRIEYAKKLIQEQPHLKNYELSDMVGYSSDKYFSQIFKKFSGITVCQYRSQLR